MPGIGRDLLDLPFAEMVRNLAVGIAEGQTALDRNSLETLKTLAETEIEVVSEITEVIDSIERDVDVDGVPVTVTGAQITQTGVRPGQLTMIQAGFLPTFYQFTEADIEVRLSITMREDRQSRSQQQGSSAAADRFGFGASRAYASTVDYRTANSYSYQAQGASLLRAKMRPVPPPSRIDPAVTTVNRVGDTPVVTTTPG